MTRPAIPAPRSTSARRAGHRRQRPRLLVVLAALAISYAATLAWMFHTQRELLYFPPAPSSRPFDFHFQSRHGPTGGWIIPGRDPGAIVVFGGNAMALSDFDRPGGLASCSSKTWILAPYPGYEGNPGSPSEAALLEHGHAVVEWARSRHKSIIPMGISLGSGVAVSVAAQSPAGIERLLLGTPYDNMAAVAADLQPWLLPGLLLRDRFDAAGFAGRVQAPAHILRAADDEIIATPRTAALVRAFAPGQADVAVAPGGHNDIWFSRQACEWIRSSTSKDPASRQVQTLPGIHRSGHK